ncbi:LytTR family transcriptional regulator DNA-binding domain-containing protein [Moritella sp. 5]|uniref:LytTR family DNA-binding domain-containing protein n=1 Tax=Moritella sp. 5 TaxID=2746231 RepID=UPI001BAB287C|nr:LytTR family transcriptional regulator DNA-binding domain-containing protein [Moritella sp. 5]QUM81397.1 LytTR family transcriptional regulator DNA-binding domain-containing protein [Moritella sp. 5]
MIKITYKKNILFVSLLIFCSNLILYSLNNKAGEQEVSQRVFLGTMKSWVRSEAFLDGVYTFNIESITTNIKRLIEFNDENNSMSAICIAINLKSFSNEDAVSHTYCSKGYTLYLLTTKHRGSITSEKENLTIGMLNLGSASWYIAESDNIPFYSRSELYWYYVFIITFIETLLFFVIMKNKHQDSTNSKTEIAESQESDILKKLEEEVCCYQLKMININKIVERNKRVFAINKNVLYASYEHPYTNILYTNGTFERLRCTLAELEKSFPLDFIRLNRSTIVNTEIIKDYSTLTTDTKTDRYYLSLNLKNNNSLLEIGKKFEQSLLERLYSGK